MTRPYPPPTKAELLALAERWGDSYEYLLDHFTCLGPRQRVWRTRALRRLLKLPPRERGRR
ncbi:MAG TPA: hypothetical protein VF041_23225 [Gemmatimonadaceae bacterium]